MRLLLTSLLLIVATSCHEARRVDQINIRLSGELPSDIMVNSRGDGRFLVMDHAQPKSGSFHLSAAEFQRLRDQLEPFRRTAVPFSEASARELGMRKCPSGVPSRPGGRQIYIHWTSADLDQHYIADLGCDYAHNQSRNIALLKVVKSLPLPSNG